MDDMLLIEPKMAEIKSTKVMLKSEFDMKNFGQAKRILGMDVVRHT